MSATAAPAGGPALVIGTRRYPVLLPRLSDPRLHLAAVIITLVGCDQGLGARGGALGVGRATTRAVVIASVSILIADYLIAVIMFRQ